MRKDWAEMSSLFLSKSPSKLSIFTIRKTYVGLFIKSTKINHLQYTRLINLNGVPS